MAFTSRRKRESTLPSAPPPTPSEPVAAPTPDPAQSIPTPALGDLRAVIPEGTKGRGVLRATGSIRIDASLTSGSIESQRAVIVGENASLKADIRAETAVISGSVEGDIEAQRKITLHKTAKVVGDLCTPGIVIEEGAKLEGRIVIG